MITNAEALTDTQSILVERITEAAQSAIDHNLEPDTRDEALNIKKALHRRDWKTARLNLELIVIVMPRAEASEDPYERRRCEERRAFQPLLEEFNAQFAKYLDTDSSND